MSEKKNQKNQGLIPEKTQPADAKAKTEADAKAKALAEQEEADRKEAEAEGPESLAVYLAEKTLAQALAAKSAKSEADAKVKINTLIDQIKDACMESGFVGNLLLTVKKDGLDYSIPEDKITKTTKNGSSKSPHPFTQQVIDILVEDPTLKDKQISEILLKRGVIHSAGQIFGAANRWRKANIPNFGTGPRK